MNGEFIFQWICIKKPQSSTRLNCKSSVPRIVLDEIKNQYSIQSFCVSNKLETLSTVNTRLFHSIYKYTAQRSHAWLQFIRIERASRINVSSVTASVCVYVYAKHQHGCMVTELGTVFVICTAQT